MKNIPEIKIKLYFKKKIAPENLYTIKSTEDTYEVFKEIFNADTINWTEELVLLCLNNANKLIGFYKVSHGGMTSTVVDPRIIFSVALNCGANKIILAHNHQAGV